MALNGWATQLRIFIGEADRLDGRPLYERIVEAARGEGMAGATVLRGVLSFGATSHLHSAKVLRLSEDLPIVIEIVDSEEKIMAFLPQLDALLERTGRGGLVTMEKVEVIRYSSRAT